MTQLVKPKKKSTSPIFRLEDILYIGGCGVSTQIPDPTRCIEHLFELMDGTHTVTELHNLMQLRYPEVVYEEVVTAVAEFDRSGFLENGVFNAEGLLDEYELARWDRNINFLGTFVSMKTSKYKLQHLIKTARIALLGLGGLGSHLLYDLAALGAQDVRVVDFDRVELANLNRQILYNEADVGRLKSEVAKERIQAFSPRMKLDVTQIRLSSTEDILKIIEDREYVLCVADRPKVEIINWVNEACVRRNVPLIVGGLDTQRSLHWTMIPGVTGCLACWRQQAFAKDQVSAGLLDEKRRQQIRGDNAAFVPLVALTAGYMMSEIVRVITKIAPPVAAGRVMETRFSSMQLKEAESWTKVNDCPICQAGVSSSVDQVTHAASIAG